MARLGSPMTVLAQAGETLDQLVWRAIGMAAPAVEAVLAANPGLADLGPFLPRATPVIIPVGSDAPAPSRLVQLWD